VAAVCLSAQCSHILKPKFPTFTIFSVNVAYAVTSSLTLLRYLMLSFPITCSFTGIVENFVFIAVCLD